MKYTVKVLTSINCSSTGHYYAKAVIASDGKLDVRDVDMNDFRIMHHLKPFTYKGYPQYVLTAIADQLKRLYDDGDISVFEYDRDKNKRSLNLRYHEPHHAKARSMPPIPLKKLAAVNIMMPYPRNTLVRVVHCPTVGQSLLTMPAYYATLATIQAHHARQDSVS